ncbi:MAG: carbohydrate binding domain-containing protein, partial [Armatimonadota bacterium]|nr:carbohydrate binding domain-containing protein [Armatimonadota bacterium]
MNRTIIQSRRLLLVVLVGLLLLPACAEPTAPAPGSDNLLPPLRNRQGWKMSHADTAQASLTREESAVRITVATAGKQASDVSLAYEGAVLQDGRTYTLHFRARADAPRPLEVSGQANSDPLGLQQQVALTTEWQTVQIVWTAHVRPGAALSVPQFRLGQTAGSVWIAEVALFSGKDAIAGINLVAPITTAGNWQFVLAGSAHGTMTADGSGGALFTIDAVDDTDWHAMFWFTDLDLHDGHSYLLNFRARADAPRHITAKAQVAGGDYHPIGLNEDVSLTTDWKSYTYTFQAAKTSQGNNQLVFLLGQQAGRVWLSDISLTD